MSDIPFISSEQMAKVDQLAVENGLLVMNMMEYAALNIARFTQKFPGNSILILAGKGHNGGDGIAATRHLHNWGYKVTLLLAEPPENLKETSRHHFDLASKMGMNIESIATNLPDADITIDALLGYNIHGNPREPYASLINQANNSSTTILSIDLPSGLNGSTGQPQDPCIRATATLTLDLPKEGLRAKAAQPHIGDLYLCDLGIPDFIHEKAGISTPKKLFTENSIIKIA